MTSYLYCMRSGGAGTAIAKIGVTASAKNRLSHIVHVSPFACTLVSLIAFDSRDAADGWERHILANATPFRSEGEWVVYDKRLIQLLAQVRGGRNVIHEFTYRGRRMSVERHAEAAAQAETKAGLVGEAASRIVAKRLAEGFGVEDMAVMDGVDVKFARDEVARLRASQRLPLFRPLVAAE